MVTCPVIGLLPQPSISSENDVIRSTTSSSPELLGTVALLGCVVCWASVPVMLRGLTTSFDPWTVNGFRYPLAAVLYWPVLLAAYRQGLIDGAVWRRCLVPAAFALIAQVLWGLAPYFLAASSIGFFARLSAVWTVAAAMVFYRDERVLLGSLGFYLGAILTFLGFLIMALSRGQMGGQVTWAGIIIMLVWSFFFGMYGASVRHYLRGIHPLIGFAIVSQMVGAGTFSAMWIFGQPQQLLHQTWQTGSLLVFSSVLGIAMGHFFLFTAVQRLGAALPACVGSVTPFLTVALAFTFLGESLTAIQWVAGGTMVLGAVVLLGNQQMVVRSMRNATIESEKTA